MRIAANTNDKKLRREQSDIFIDVINLIKNKDDLKIFMESFLTESEMAYLGQRLNIIRMLAKNFSYSKIKEKMNVSSATITNAQKCLDSGGAKVEEIVLQYRFKSRDKVVENVEDDNPFRPHYPGSILK